MKIAKYLKIGLLGLLLINAGCSIKALNDGEQIQLTEAIRLNQIGFYPAAPKIAVVVEALELDDFLILSIDLQDTVFNGSLAAAKKSSYSDKQTRIADFSALTTVGTYIVLVPGLGKSYPFEIKPKVHQDLVKGAIKGFYYQRTAIEIPDAFAGKWARAAGHFDTLVAVHASAASKDRPEGTIISSSLGWYDAGDYNKYIVNSGITMGTILSLYEDFPAYCKSLSLAIPENGNTIPDVLDEALWNLRWMLSMQDPGDGGVYHKLTAANFEGMIMPGEAKSQRYVVQKSTTATLDFAAVMAQSYRVFQEFEKELPGLADSCLTASKKAWEWAIKNPDQLYDQNALNKAHDPDISTGAYGDKDVSDEFIWAAAELWVSTGDNRYMEHTDIFSDDEMVLPSWGNVEALGYYSLLRHKEKYKEAFPQQYSVVEKKMIAFADDLLEKAGTTSYATVMGGSALDFIWGSNSVCANQGIALLQAYEISQDKRYLTHALSNLDYIMGRNATGYAYVTGFGDKSPQFPHHRPSEADGIAEPVPGLIVGGPNPGQQDNCDYPSKVADESYVDAECSYAANEIAINWNAPLVYLAAAMEALQNEF